MWGVQGCSDSESCPTLPPNSTSRDFCYSARIRSTVLQGLPFGGVPTVLALDFMCFLVSPPVRTPSNVLTNPTRPSWKTAVFCLLQRTTANCCLYYIILRRFVFPCSSTRRGSCFCSPSSEKERGTTGVWRWSTMPTGNYYECYLRLMLSHIYFAAHLLQARLIQIDWLSRQRFHNTLVKHASLIHLSFKEGKRKTPSG